jgi:hypothetical protein
MWWTTFLPPMLLLVTSGSAIASTGLPPPGPRTGTLYVCPIMEPTREEHKLAMESATYRPVLGYAVQVDSGLVQGVSHDSARVVSGLDLDTRHLVSIYHATKRVESFWFDFTAASGDSLCLGLKLSYHTWQLYDGSKGECRCRRW